MDSLRQSLGQVSKLDWLRITVSVAIIACILVVGPSNFHLGASGQSDTIKVGEQIAPESNGTTVVTTQGLNTAKFHLRLLASGPNGGIFAINSSGELMYKNTTYSTYWDVDPVSDTKNSVMYVAGKTVSAEECGRETRCVRRVVERVNLSTGNVTRIYSNVGDAGRWHDVDRVGEQELLVAGIDTNRAFIVNTSTGLIEWGWEAESDFSPESGGTLGDDWTHINDVELVAGNRVMVDLRNQDTVAFIHRQKGLLENWSLGKDDNYSVLNEQHNPDYIPDSHGGPAVVVADSVNNRIVEYQYNTTTNNWMESWSWSDDKMSWPRDADRLPGGSTLITDTNSGRVFEINKSGSKVWSVTFQRPYEAERLGTGDESAGAKSAQALNLTSQADGTTRTEETGWVASLKDGIISLVPGPVKNAVIFLKPPSVGFAGVAAVFLTTGLISLWLACEIYHLKRRVRG